MFNIGLGGPLVKAVECSLALEVARRQGEGVITKGRFVMGECNLFTYCNKKKNYITKKYSMSYCFVL